MIYADTVAALAGPFAPGAVIALKRGGIYQGPITLKASGTADAPITLTAYGSGPAPQIKGNPALYSDCLTVVGSYVEIDSLLLTDTNRAGVQIPAGSTFVRVRDCEMTRVGIGVNVCGNNWEVTRCSIHDLSMVVDDTKPGNDYGANGVVIAGSYGEAGWNKIVNAKAASDDYGTDGGGFEIFGTVTDVSVHDNWVEASDGFLELGGPAGSVVSNVSFRGNTSLNNDGFLDLHNAGGQFGVTLTGFSAVLNTVVEETPDWSMHCVRADGVPAPGTVDISRNVFYLLGGNAVWKQPGAEYHSQNCFYLGAKSLHLFDNWSMALSPGEILADPGFVDRVGRNFALVAGSPAVGRGAC